MIWQSDKRAVVFAEKHGNGAVEHVFYITEAKNLLKK